MTKVVLLSSGFYLDITTEAMLELVQRGSGAIKEYAFEGKELEDWRMYLSPREYLPFKNGFLVHNFYQSRIRRGDIDYQFDYWKRDDPILVQLVEEWGDKILHNPTKDEHVFVATIPDGVDWGREEDTDGMIEWISEKRRVWFVGNDGETYEEIRP